MEDDAESVVLNYALTLLRARTQVPGEGQKAPGNGAVWIKSYSFGWCETGVGLNLFTKN